ncbi:MAG: nucleotidyltransferase family protein, partial [Methyloprofundus sp.]|nr:nucleotidyltransferase family protein [Methyloprofundus sp.]
MFLQDWQLLSVQPQTTLLETMVVLDREAKQIVLVVDDHKRLLGTVTDGDIRRALLAGSQLNDSVALAMNEQPVVGKEEGTETAWRQIMKRKSCRHLPILNSKGQVVLVFYDKRSTLELKQNPVVLMVGGLGKRLRPLTETTPKPMLNVGGRPILETIVERLVEQGFSQFYFCVNYLGDQIQSYFGNGERWGVTIEYVLEQQQLGTAGAMSLIGAEFSQPCILMNGDLLTKVDFGVLVDFHTQNKSDVTVCAREYSQQVPYGVIELNNNQVTQIVEKPVYRYFVNAGIYVLAPEVIQSIPYNQYMDMPDLLQSVLDKQGEVSAFPITEYWKDIGRIPDFEQAQVDYEVHFTKLHD